MGLTSRVVQFGMTFIKKRFGISRLLHCVEAGEPGPFSKRVV